MKKEIKDRILGLEKVEWKKLQQFQPENLKVMTQESFDLLKNNIIKRNFLSTFMVWKEQENYWILDGHHRKYALDALEKDGHKIPAKFSCVMVECDSKEDANYVLLSYASSHAKMDELGLSEFIHTNNMDFEDLKSSFDIPGVDFEKMMNENIEVLEPQEEDDAAPELKIEATTKLGDIWILGNHRLMCGDSTNIDHVISLMLDEKADMVFTDPPYNADYSSRVDKDRIKPWGGIINDNMSDEAFDVFLQEVMNTLAASIKVGASVYCCIDWKHYPQLTRAYKSCFTHKSSLIWDKKNFGLGTYYRTQYEIVLFGVYGDKLNVWNAGSDERDVWSMSREPVGNYVHPTQKPVELIERAINNSSNKGDTILDLFGGSGSTLVASEKLGRKSRLMELAPNYCDVIIKRWQNYTNKKAIHEETKKSFDELSPLV